MLEEIGIPIPMEMPRGWLVGQLSWLGDGMRMLMQRAIPGLGAFSPPLLRVEGEDFWVPGYGAAPLASHPEPFVLFLGSERGLHPLPSMLFAGRAH